MTKRNAKTNVATIETPSILLKTLHNDIMRDNKDCTLDTKQMRIWLRTNMRDAHIHNSSWVFTTSQAHEVHMKFNPVYRARIEREAKKANAKPRAQRVRKARVIDDATQTINNEAHAIEPVA